MTEIPTGVHPYSFDKIRIRGHGDTMPEERWKVVTGHDRYEVSDAGNVRSAGRYDHLGKWREPKPMALKRDKDGYLSVHLGRNTYLFTAW